MDDERLPPEDEVTFRVMMKARLYHADLMDAARKVGGIKKLADDLGVSDATLSSWIGLKAFPKLTIMRSDGRERPNTKLRKKWLHICTRLYDLTGKSAEQLFPNFVRLSGLLEAPKTAEVVQEVNSGTMLSFRDKVLAQLPAPDRGLEIEHSRKVILKALDSMHPRDAAVLKLRYGLNDENRCYSLEETGRVLRIGKERTRQIEARAMRKLRDRAPQFDLQGAAASVLNLQECPECGDLCAVFDFCPYQCSGARCFACHVKHMGRCPRKIAASGVASPNPGG